MSKGAVRLLNSSNQSARPAFGLGLCRSNRSRSATVMALVIVSLFCRANALASRCVSSFLMFRLTVIHPSTLEVYHYTMPILAPAKQRTSHYALI